MYTISSTKRQGNSCRFERDKRWSSSSESILGYWVGNKGWKFSCVSGFKYLLLRYLKYKMDRYSWLARILCLVWRPTSKVMLGERWTWKALCIYMPFHHVFKNSISYIMCVNHLSFIIWTCDICTNFHCNDCFTFMSNLFTDDENLLMWKFSRL